MKYDFIQHCRTEAFSQPPADALLSGPLHRHIRTAEIHIKPPCTLKCRLPPDVPGASILTMALSQLHEPLSRLLQQHIRYSTLQGRYHALRSAECA